MEQDRAAQRAIAKAARHLLPFLCLCYAVNFLDRVNVGFAALARAGAWWPRRLLFGGCVSGALLELHGLGGLKG